MLQVVPLGTSAATPRTPELALDLERLTAQLGPGFPLLLGQLGGDLAHRLLVHLLRDLHPLPETLEVHLKVLGLLPDLLLGVFRDRLDGVLLLIGQLELFLDVLRAEGIGATEADALLKFDLLETL